MGLADLPLELKLRVLSFLKQQDLCRLACVSREFRRLALDPSLWKRLELSGDPDAGVVAELLARATMLDELVLTQCPRVRPWAELVPERLRKLDLGYSAHVDADTLALFVDRCPSLSHVIVDGCPDVDDEAVEVLCRLPKLELLNLRHCRRVTADGLRVIASARRMRCLSLTGIDGIGDSVFSEVVQALSKELVFFELDGEYVTDAGLAYLLRCDELTSFGLYNADSLTDAGMETIKAVGVSRVGLCSVSLMDQSDATRYLGQSSAESTLRALLRGRGCPALPAPVLPSCPHLEVLALQNCWDITEDGLAIVVARCKNLRHLDLRGLYKVTGSSLRKLPKCLPKLRILSLACCCLVPDGLPSFLASKVPGLKVYGYDETEAMPQSDPEDPFVSDAEDEPAEDTQADTPAGE
ncbi:unnamed protein product, partial [Ixodes hexagonus]